MNLQDGDVAAPLGMREAEIEQQLTRLLADNRFRNSKRLPSFLRFVITETIQGRADSLKERTIGSAVFGRALSYDTAGDPIVRVAAAELRKRLAQYYQDRGHASEIRISLPTGSYIPCFESPSAGVAGKDVVETNASENSASARALTALPTDTEDGRRATRTGSRINRSVPLLTSLGVLAVLCVAAASFFFLQRKMSPLEEFWAPVLKSGDAITFYLPYVPNGVPAQNDTKPAEEAQLPRPGMNAVVLADFRSYVSLTSFLESRQRNLLFKSSNTSTIADLETGPAVLIGAFDNPWVLRLSSPLRYHFGTNPDMQAFWIEDGLSHPAVRWSVDRKLQVTNNFCDYAIVARFLDQNTGKPVVLVAGITGEGTTAASKFVTDSDQFSRIPGALANWEQKNIEVVLKIQILDHVPATPKVEAAYFW